ncbi:MAG: CRISPR-associated endoribonuclease Cas6, partial [Candidatus Methanomethylicia archaeon]
KLFNPEKAHITLPCHYNELVQGFIYRHLDGYLAKHIHSVGFKDSKSNRSFKFFTFSRLIPDEKLQIEDGKIHFYGGINLTISSCLDEFIRSLALNLLKDGEVRLGDEKLVVSSVHVETVPEYREKIYVRTLSPITVYSTLITSDGKKKTYYYSPFEKEFEKLIIENLNKKLRTLTGKVVRVKGSIKPYRVSTKNQKVIFYKNTVIKGWDGIFELSLPQELFNLAFETGLGAKNSQGFGCIEVWERK